MDCAYDCQTTMTTTRTHPSNTSRWQSAFPLVLSLQILPLLLCKRVVLLLCGHNYNLVRTGGQSSHWQTLLLLELEDNPARRKIARLGAPIPTILSRRRRRGPERPPSTPPHTLDPALPPFVVLRTTDPLSALWDEYTSTMGQRFPWERNSLCRTRPPTR